MPMPCRFYCDFKASETDLREQIHAVMGRLATAWDWRVGARSFVSDAQWSTRRFQVRERRADPGDLRESCVNRAIPLHAKVLILLRGEVAERSKAAVLKNAATLRRFPRDFKSLGAVLVQRDSRNVATFCDRMG